MLESYFEMPKVVAVKVLTMYKQYLEHTQRVGRVFEDARALLGYGRVHLSDVCAIVTEVSHTGRAEHAARFVPGGA